MNTAEFENNIWTLAEFHILQSGRIDHHDYACGPALNSQMYITYGKMHWHELLISK